MSFHCVNSVTVGTGIILGEKVNKYSYIESTIRIIFIRNI